MAERSSKVPRTRRLFYVNSAKLPPEQQVLYRDHNVSPSSSSRGGQPARTTTPAKPTHNGSIGPNHHHSATNRDLTNHNNEAALNISVDSNCNMNNRHLCEVEDQPDLGTVRASLAQHRADDYLPTSMTFGLFDICLYLFSIVSYLADVGADIWVAYMYYNNGDFMWFVLTAVFVLAPAITMTVFSLMWYLQDHCHRQDTKHDLGSVGRAWWASRSIFLFLQIGPVVRYVECLIYGVRSKRRRDWYMVLLLEDTDAALLRLVECFMEAAPQLVLQIYIVCTMQNQHRHEGGLLAAVQLVSIVSSLASMSWGITYYHRSLRLSLPHKANLTWGGVSLKFLWLFFIIGSRVIALAMFATVHSYWVFVVAGIHWLVMLIWILLQRTKFCYTRCQEVFFNMVMAVVYIFCYFNLLEGHTRLRYVFYHLVMYTENMVLIMAWYAVIGSTNIWYINPALTAVLGGFFVGISFQILYYACCHPNNITDSYEDKKINICVPWDNLYLCRSPPPTERVVDEEITSKSQSQEMKEVQQRPLLQPVPGRRATKNNGAAVCVRQNGPQSLPPPAPQQTTQAANFDRVVNTDFYPTPPARKPLRHPPHQQQRLPSEMKLPQPNPELYQKPQPPARQPIRYEQHSPAEKRPVKSVSSKGVNTDKTQAYNLAQNKKKSRKPHSSRKPTSEIPPHEVGPEGRPPRPKIKSKQSAESNHGNSSKQHKCNHRPQPSPRQSLYKHDEKPVQV